MNNNSVAQLLMQALLGSRYQRFNADTVHINAATQTVGSGQHDLTSAGTYSAGVDHDYTIKITATNKFQWKKDNGAYNGSDITITGSAQTLADGVTVTFGHTTGYTINDQFLIQARLGYAITTEGLKNIAINDVGTSAILDIYDANELLTGNEAVLYHGVTADWTDTNDPINRPYTTTRGSLYIVMSSSAPADLNIGFI